MEQNARQGALATLGRLWNELSSAQRAVAMAFLVVAVVVVCFVAAVASRPKMAVLFSGLEAEDAGAIIEKLDEQKVAYRVSSDGGTIEVPANQVYETRLRMATQGLPQGGSVGFEVFDKNNFGMTEFAQRLNYQRAMQGELTRTICQLAPVMSARVHIAIPEDKIYASEQEAPTASVVLKLRRGTPLSDEQVGGIIHLVSAAVEGMEPGAVTVIDSHGNILSQGGPGSGGAGLTSNQCKIQRQFEERLAHSLQTMMARIVGPDKTVVRVSATLNFDQKQTKSELYEPTSGPADQTPRGILASEDTTTESYSGGAMPEGVAAGVDSAGPNDEYSRTQATTHYQVNKRIEETVSGGGEVERLSVAVLVDESVPAARISAIREAVTAASGLNDTRGDQITVQRIAFEAAASEAADAEMASASKSETVRSVAKNGASVIVVLLFLLCLRRIMKQVSISAPAQGQLATPGSEQQAAGESAHVGQPAAPVAAVDNQPGPQSTSRPDIPVPSEVASSSPEELAGLVKSWMSDRG